MMVCTYLVQTYINFNKISIFFYITFLKKIIFLFVFPVK